MLHPTRRHFLQATTASALLALTPRLLQAQTLPTSRPTTLESTPKRTAKQTAAIAKITALATASPIAAYPWQNRGKAPIGYLKGLSVSFAKLHHDLSRNSPYALEMARPLTPDADPNKDALQHYQPLFAQLNLDNSKGGPETLRNLFTLLLGLGMRESSGRYCEGRDRSASNTTAETAEAGLFQTSFNARRAHPLLPQLFNEYKKDPNTNNYLDLFKEGVKPKPDEAENYGEGDGRTFQQLSKQNPFFATAFTALALRNLRKHWGPINRRAAELKPEANALFKDIQTLLDKDNLGPLL